MIVTHLDKNAARMGGTVFYGKFMDIFDTLLLKLAGAEVNLIVLPIKCTFNQLIK